MEAVASAPIPIDSAARLVGAPETGPLEAIWLGRMPYREAWAFQKRTANERADGLIGDRLLLVEHDPVLTLGR